MAGPIVPDPITPSKAYVQESGKYSGYFVSQTALRDKTHKDIDPNKYVDATNIPYVVFPPAFIKLAGTGGLGDFGMARNVTTGQTSPMIVADTGGTPQNNIGKKKLQGVPLEEVSIRLAENLGGKNVNPRKAQGAPKGPFIYVIFPKSAASPAWPLSEQEIKKRAEAELTKLGGWDAVLPCIAK